MPTTTTTCSCTIRQPGTRYEVQVLDRACPAHGQPAAVPAAPVDVVAAVALAGIRSTGDPAPALGRAPVEAMRHASLWHERSELRVYVDVDGDGFTLDDARRLRLQLDHLIARAEVLQRSR